MLSWQLTPSCEPPCSEGYGWSGSRGVTFQLETVNGREMERERGREERERGKKGRERGREGEGEEREGDREIELEIKGGELSFFHQNKTVWGSCKFGPANQRCLLTHLNAFAHGEL